MGEVEKLENPRARGKALASNLSGLWRYRVGDYKVICNILENELLIMTLKVEHRKSVYK